MSIFIAVAVAAVAENIVLAKMLGLCPFAGLSRRLDIAVGVGMATTVVLTIAAAAAWLINNTLLATWAAAQPLAFIAAAAIIVQAAEQLLKLRAPQMHRMLGVYLPLITTNCAVLAVMLTAVRQSPDSLSQAVSLGFGGGLGFMLAVACLALLRARIVESRAPAAFRGAPLTMITAGWMALAFSGLHGIFA